MISSVDPVRDVYFWLSILSVGVWVSTLLIGIALSVFFVCISQEALGRHDA